VRTLPTIAFLAFFCATGSLGCGSRTGLETLGTAGDPSGESPDGGTSSGGSGPASYGLCDAVNGPVPDGEGGGEGVTRCNADFPHCVDISGQWVCCNGPGPYDGPGGSCMFL
jgi:hypothetical protein